jgi:hypothetical protein
MRVAIRSDPARPRRDLRRSAAVRSDPARSDAILAIRRYPEDPGANRREV